jgi:type II secretory pathway pseudopilin PulG
MSGSMATRYAPAKKPRPRDRSSSYRRQFAMYGHGSLLGAGALLAQQTQLAQLAGQADEAGDVARVAVRVATFVNEVGIAARIDHDQLRIVLGVRTAWANSDEVVTRLLAIPTQAVLEGKGDQLVAPIIAGAPSSPLANDVKAGFGGMLVQTAVLGAMAATTIPAFTDYMSRAKASDVAVQLNRLGRMLVRAYGESQTLPIGDSALLPAGQCCGQAGNKCFADPLAFSNDKVWNQIGFVLEDPIAYQFHYHSDDGKSATVQAVGDLDCDGKQAIYTLRVTVDPSTRGATYTIEAEGQPHGVY